MIPPFEYRLFVWKLRNRYVCAIQDKATRHQTDVEAETLTETFKLAQRVIQTHERNKQKRSNLTVTS